MLEKTLLAGTILAAACSGSGGTADSASVSSSEVATSTVSGALNTSAGTTLGWNGPRLRATTWERLVRDLSPVSVAHAATWTCTGGALDPKFEGPGDYAFTPVSCSVTWGLGRTATSSWSTTFALDYSAACDTTHPRIDEQVAGCALTRTTASGGNTRSITGPDGFAYSITHDTNGAGSGWDDAVSPAPSNGGVSVSCGAGGCAQSAALVIDGSHLTGTVAIGKDAPKTIWDHTVSTTTDGLQVSGTGTSREVNGQVTVQHNLIHETAVVTFANVGYGDADCCFPTTGSVSAAITDGARAGKSESLVFSNVCGVAELTNASGETSQLTLAHCL